MTALDFAIADIGYTENPAGSNRTKYGRWYGVDGVPWCMEAVQYWFNMAGQKLPYKTASCSALLKWYKLNQPECVSDSPKKNAICIFAFSSTRWHTGIVERWNPFFVTCVEGNTSDRDTGSQDNGGGVYRRTRKRSLVKAFIIPKEDDHMTGEEIYNALMEYTATLPLPAWVKTNPDWQLAKALGITDGTNPMQLIPRYQAAIMAARAAAKNKDL